MTKIVLLYISLCVGRYLELVQLSINQQVSTFNIDYSIMTKLFPEDVAKVTGLVEAVSGVGLVLGPAIGTVFYSLGGFPAPFYFMSAIFLLATLLTYVCINSKVETSEEVKNNVSPHVNMFSLLKNWRIVISFFATSLSLFQFTFIDPFLSKYMLDKYDVKEDIVGLVFVALTLGYLVNCLLVGVAAKWV